MASNTHTTDGAQIDDLEQRVNDLEQQVEPLAVDDPNGKTVSFGSLLELGLTRRQAFAALGYVALGASSIGAIAKAIGSVQAQSGDSAIYGMDRIGSSDQPVGELFVEDLYNTTDNISADSILTDELNHVYQLDPTADDFGAAVNSISQQMDPWDILKVPPVEYECDTTATPDKQICIVGDAPPVRHHAGLPRVVKTSDVPIIETQSVDRDGLSDVYPAMLSLSNISIDSDISDTTPAVILHGRSTVEDVVIRNQGSHGIHAEKLDGDNLNGSQISVSGYDNNGDVVRMENNSSGTNETNGCQIEVLSSSQNDRAVNIEDGFGNKVTVIVAEGGHGDAIVRLNDNSNVTWIHYIENQSATGVLFDNGSGGSTAYVGHSGLAPGDDFIFNEPNNTGRQIGDLSRGFAENHSRNYMFLENGLEFQGPGGSGYDGDLASIYLGSDGEVHVTNAAGTDTQIS